MDKYTTYVGMDVHARSIEASAIDVTTGEVFSRSFGNCPQAADVAEWLAMLPQPVYCAYESGCRQLATVPRIENMRRQTSMTRQATLPDAEHRIMGGRTGRIQGYESEPA